MTTSADHDSARMHVPAGQKQSAVMCVLKAGEEFLLLRRNRQPNMGKLTPVGGKIDAFESPLQAALRETREETGIEVERAKYCGLLVETSPGKYNWICFVYLIEIARCDPPECDEGVLQWVAASQLSAFATPVTDPVIYRYLLDGKPFMFSARFSQELALLEMTEEIEGKTLFPRSGDLKHEVAR